MSTSRHVLRFPATSEAFDGVAARLRDLLDAHRVAGPPRSNVEVVFEEVATNIIRHGSTSGDVEVTIAFGGDEIVLTFDDNGVPFDPRDRLEPVIPASIDEAQVGGLGLLLVGKISTRLIYTRTPQCRNHLTLAIPAR